MECMRMVIPVVVLSGCAYGAGPVVGYGMHHGWFAGAEGGGGAGPLQATVGYQSTQKRIYLRGDIDVDDAYNPGTAAVGGRIGGGLSVMADNDVDDQVRGMFVVGPNRAFAFNPPNEEQECPEGWQNIIETSIELRYLAEWQVVLTGRFTRQNYTCSDGSD